MIITTFDHKKEFSICEVNKFTRNEIEEIVYKLLNYSMFFAYGTDGIKLPPYGPDNKPKTVDVIVNNLKKDIIQLKQFKDDTYWLDYCSSGSFQHPCVHVTTNDIFIIFRLSFNGRDAKITPYIKRNDNLHKITSFYKIFNKWNNPSLRK